MVAVERSSRTGVGMIVDTQTASADVAEVESLSP
jgi:hypothetical protein